MKINFIAMLLLMVGLNSCGSTVMDAELVKSMVLGEGKGFFADLEIGDNWNDVKGSVHEGWEVNDADHQLIKNFDELNFVVISTSVNDENIIKELSFSIKGKEGNHLLITEMKVALEKRLNDKCSSVESGESWDYLAPNGDECGVQLITVDDEGTGSKSFSIKVFNLSPM